MRGDRTFFSALRGENRQFQPLLPQNHLYAGRNWGKNFFIPHPNPDHFPTCDHRKWLSARHLRCGHFSRPAATRPVWWRCRQADPATPQQPPGPGTLTIWALSGDYPPDGTDSRRRCFPSMAAHPTVLRAAHQASHLLGLLLPDSPQRRRQHHHQRQRTAKTHLRQPANEVVLKPE